MFVEPVVDLLRIEPEQVSPFDERDAPFGNESSHVADECIDDPMMRVTTLKATGGAVGGLLAYYCGLAERTGPDVSRGPVDYYLDPDEPAGRWWGSGCVALGLDGEVEADELRDLLDARHPGDGPSLGRPFVDSSARGFDATFSAPKSVSVLWALTPDPWVRAEVLAAHDRAVDAALAWFEQHGCVTRRGHDGVYQVDAQGITAALFRQHTSRTVDPQLHTHAVISSKVQDPTGRWLALDARFLKFQQRTIGWVYDAVLRTELSRRLGVAWEELTGGQAELAQVPHSVREAFSQRTVQVDAKRDELIERWMHEHENAEPDRETIARLGRAAVLASRPPKVHGRSAAELHDTWRQQAVELGLNVQELTAEALASDRHLQAPIDERALAHEALRRVTEESSTWLVADLARHVATLLPPDAAPTAEEQVVLIDRIADLAAERCIDLGPVYEGPLRRDGRPVLEHVTDGRLTTRHVVDQERALQKWMLSRAYPVEPAADRQAAAAEAMAGACSAVVVVGPAGTGKTRATAQAVETLQRQGRAVVGLAPSGKAADVLRAEAGCDTDTLAGFLIRHRDALARSPWPVGTTVILDEAGMTSTADLAELVGLAHRNHWRLIAIGDPAQLPSVGRGGVFAHGCDTVPHHELDLPRRFQEPWEAEASLGLRAGDPAAVQRYAGNDRLHRAHPTLLAQRVATAHSDLTRTGRSVAITTTSRATSRDINRAIQAQRPHPSAEPRARAAGGTDIYVGDRVATRRNDRKIRTDVQQPIRNRQVWTVAAIRADGSIVISHPERGRATLPPAYVREHLELGWAVTAYGAQGDTVDVGIAVIEPGTNRSQTYVAMTRGREANHAWVVDPHGDLDPAQALESALGRTDDRTSALATMDRLCQAAGRPAPRHDLGPELALGIGVGR